MRSKARGRLSGSKTVRNVEVAKLKLLAIIGSPRANGNTYKAVRQTVAILSEKDSTLEFESVQLSMADFRPCRGCYVCIAKGEDKCPLKDERANLETKMKLADGVIFASPVYTFNVSWTMKNFLDRFAYRCHRPDFHGKKIMVVTTTGGIGLGFVATLLSLTLGTMGFVTCAKAGVTFPPLHEKDDVKLEKEMSKLKKQTNVFYRKLADMKPVKPSLMKLIEFIKQKQAFSKAPQDSADYRFWRKKGWFEKGTGYYYDVHIGFARKIIIMLLSKIKI